jgi:hypothetical protein
MPRLWSRWAFWTSQDAKTHLWSRGYTYSRERNNWLYPERYWPDGSPRCVTHADMMAAAVLMDAEGRGGLLERKRDA